MANGYWEVWTMSDINLDNLEALLPLADHLTHEDRNRRPGDYTEFAGSVAHIFPELIRRARLLDEARDVLLNKVVAYHEVGSDYRRKSPGGYLPEVLDLIARIDAEVKSHPCCLTSIRHPDRHDSECPLPDDHFDDEVKT